MAAKYTTESEWKLAKADINSGIPRAKVMKKHGIGRNKYYRIQCSSDYEDYKIITHDATAIRAARRMERNAKIELDKISQNAVYDRPAATQLDGKNADSASAIEKTISWLVFLSGTVLLGLIVLICVLIAWIF